MAAECRPVLGGTLWQATKTMENQLENQSRNIENRENQLPCEEKKERLSLLLRNPIGFHGLLCFLDWFSNWFSKVFNPLWCLTAVPNKRSGSACQALDADSDCATDEATREACYVNRVTTCS